MPVAFFAPRKNKKHTVMMKRMFLSMVCMLMCLAGFSQDVKGKWYTEAGDAGVHLLSGLTKKKDKWEGGRIYNPKNGKDYKCSIWLDGDKLKVRGYIGFLYETQTWRRK